MAFAFADDSAQTAQDSPYSVATKDGLTCAKRDKGHAVSTFVLPCLPGQRGLRRRNRQGECPSNQFVTMWHVLSVLEEDGMVGCDPLLLLSLFHVAVQCWVLVDGWGHSAPQPTRIMHRLLMLATAEQKKLCLPLNPGDIWNVLTLATTFDPAMKAVLAQCGNVVQSRDRLRVSYCCRQR